MTPEFSYVVKLSDLGPNIRDVTVTANDSERRALAKRFDIPVIDSFSAIYNLKTEDERVRLAGTIQAKLEQVCSISGEAFPSTIAESFEVIFLPRTEIKDNDEEIELASEDCDMIEFEGNKIDIGEAIAQTLYLALDPFPRGPNADTVAKQQGLKSEEEAGPFGALAALKDKLG